MSSILVVSELFYPEGGGAEKATYLILKHLAEHNFKITVLTSTKDPVKIPGVRYYITPFLRHTNRLIKQVYLKLLARDAVFAKLLREHDVLYIPLYAYPLIPIAKQRGLRVVVHLHNYMPVRYTSVKYFFEPDTVSLLDEFKLAVFHEHYAQNSLLRTLLMPLSFSAYLLNKRQIAEADKLICVSFRQAEIVVRSNPYLIGKVEVVYNPVPLELLNREPRKELDSIPTFLYVSGDSYTKGFHILLYVLNRLGKQGVKARFILAGKYGPRSLRTLGQLSNKYGNLEIRVLGRIEFDRLKELHRRAWALLHPSICDEPLPYTVVEASLLGTIPIASKAGGVEEILSNSVGDKYLFDLEDLKSVIRVLNTVINSDPYDIINDGIKLRESLLLRFKNEVSLSKLLKLFIDLYRTGSESHV
jgi:glycosyltransferase involved in cell wall biosynthesis